MHQPGAAEDQDVGVGQAQHPSGLGGQRGHGRGVPQRVGRLEIDEVGECGQGILDLVSLDRVPQLGFRSDDRVPGTDLVEPTEDLRGVPAEELRELGVELPTGTVAREGDSASHTAEPVRHLDVLRQLTDPRRLRDQLALQPAGPAASVPAFVRRNDRTLHLGAEPEPGREATSQVGVPLDHRVDLAMAAEGERQPDAKPVQGRVPGTDGPQLGDHPVEAPEVVPVLARLQRDVVAEPLRLLVGVDMAAHVDEQGAVVERRP